MKKLLYVLTGLCLLAGVFTGCEDPLKDPDDPNGGSVSGGDGITTIEGVVTSKTTGKPLLLASVTLLPADKMTVTDTAGSFRFRDIAAGTYKLQVKRTGYAPYTTGEIKVAAGKTVRYNIELEAEQSDLQIQNPNGEVIEELSIEDDATQGTFVLKNTGTKIIEWEIPKLAVDWISDFSMQSGKLAPGASDIIEFSIDRTNLSNGANETTLYIGSSVGDKELLIKVGVERSFILLDEYGEEISELDMSDVDRCRFQIKNTGNCVLNWSISGYGEGLKFDSYSGALDPADRVTIELTMNLSRVPEGSNETVVHISAMDVDKQLTVNGVSFSGYREDLGGGISLKMLPVQWGMFEMGATEEQGDDAYDKEKPVHQVTLDNFYIGETEVTQAQWKAVMGTTIEQQRDKTNRDNLFGKGDDYPMYYVNWNEAQEFCKKLSQMTGKTYRLPTEAEWEYAARGGNKSQHYKYAGSNDVNEVAWNPNSDGAAHPVGTKKANELGIYDMSGNVREWCSDWYGEDYYSGSPSVNPQGPASGSSRVVRGGSWYVAGGICRVSYRAGDWLNTRSFFGGFRVACSAE